MTEISTLPASVSGYSKHAIIARSLISDIAAGKYPVGGRLPSEPDLALALGVNRQTLRTALRHLRDLGLIVGVQGVGNFVRASSPASQFSYAFDSIDDLLQYAMNTPVRIVSQTKVTLTQEQAAWLGRKAGELWRDVRTIRMDPETREPIACSSVVIPYLAGDVLREPASSHEAIFSRVERKLGESITEVHQTLTAGHAGKFESDSLEIPVGSAILCVERRYYGRAGDLIEASWTQHPADKFKYRMKVRIQPVTRQS